MITLSASDITKIDSLRTVTRDWSDRATLTEFIRVDFPAPTGTVYYSSIKIDQVPGNFAFPFPSVQTILKPGDYPRYFLERAFNGILSDADVPIEIWDSDETFLDLILLHGTGHPVEIFLWSPTVDLTLSVWQGHLKGSKGHDGITWAGSVASGFRSPTKKIPDRAHLRECLAIFGGQLTTQDEINQGGCPYNKHIGGGTGIAGFTSCPQRTPGDCTTRGVNTAFHLSHRSVKDTIVNRQTKGSDLLATSKGNETNLKEPIRVVMGWRYIRQLLLLDSFRAVNNKHPEKGFWHVLYELCEGPIAQAPVVKVGGQTAQSTQNAIHYDFRNGRQGQNRSSFSPNVHEYSKTALFRYVWGWTNPTETPVPEAEAHIEGLSDIRQYTNATTYTTGSTNNRIWHIVRMLIDPIWGRGENIANIGIDETFIDTAAWGKKEVQYTNPDGGDVLRHLRSCSNVDLQERTTRQQIEDMCWAGRFSKPFIHGGKIQIVPLKAYSQAELDAAPVFSDKTDGSITRTIIRNADGTSTLGRPKQTDTVDLINEIELTFDDENNENKEQVIRVRDRDVQKAAGQAMGSRSILKNPKKYSALGVTNENQAIKLAFSLLDLGKFDTGGIKNNLEISFNAHWLDALVLHEFKLIKVDSARLVKYLEPGTANPFQWFVVKNLKFNSDHSVTVTAQAYNKSYMDSFEVEPTPNLNPFFPNLPSFVCGLEFDESTFGRNKSFIEFEILEGGLEF